MCATMMLASCVETNLDEMKIDGSVPSQTLAQKPVIYTIGACTAASILLAQTILNVMGTIDLLPFTGVTFPFVSNGGSAVISAWGMLAFIKASDVRQNASFAIRAVTKKNREVTE